MNQGSKEFLVGFSNRAVGVTWLALIWPVAPEWSWRTIIWGTLLLVHVIAAVVVWTRAIVPGSRNYTRGAAVACLFYAIAAIMGSYWLALGLGLWSMITLVGAPAYVYISAFPEEFSTGARLGESSGELAK